MASTIDNDHSEPSQTGKGHPLVLLHGYSGNSEIHWKNQINNSLIRAEYHIITPNMFSFTNKNRMEIQTKTNSTNEVKKLRYFLKKHIKISKPLFLVGYSIGGALALTYASFFPQDVLGIILVSPLAFLNSFIPTVPTLPKRTITKNFTRKESSFYKATWVVFKRIIKTLSTLNLKLNDERVVKSLKNLHLLNIPILLTYGLEDSINPSQNYELLKKYLPLRTQIVPFQGDHSFHDTEPEKFNEVLLSFCKDVRSKKNKH